MTDTKIPSELVISQKWDKLLERVAINAGTGFVIGLCASFVFSRLHSRFALIPRVRLDEMSRFTPPAVPDVASPIPM